MDILITNNPLVVERCGDVHSVNFVDGALIDVLIRVRSFIHDGHRLLTHPLSGSVKPNETAYKSVLISGSCGKVDEQSVLIIGECILATQKFKPREISVHHLTDLQEVDFSLIIGAL